MGLYVQVYANETTPGSRNTGRTMFAICLAIKLLKIGIQTLDMPIHLLKHMCVSK